MFTARKSRLKIEKPQSVKTGIAQRDRTEFDRAYELFHHKKYEEAKAQFIKLKKLHPGNIFDADMGLIRCAIGQKQFDSALCSLALWENCEDALLKLDERRQRQIFSAKSFCLQLQGKREKNKEVKKKLYTEARTLLLEKVCDQGNLDLQNQIYGLDGKIEEPSTVLKKGARLIRRFPMAVNIFLTHAVHISIYEHDSKKIIQILDRLEVGDLNKSNSRQKKRLARLYAFKSLCYLDLNQLDKAFSVANLAIKLDPDYYFSYKCIAKYHQIRADIKNDVEEFKKAEKYFNLAMARNYHHFDASHQIKLHEAKVQIEKSPAEKPEWADEDLDFCEQADLLFDENDPNKYLEGLFERIGKQPQSKSKNSIERVVPEHWDDEYSDDEQKPITESSKWDFGDSVDNDEHASPVSPVSRAEPTSAAAFAPLSSSPVKKEVQVAKKPIKKDKDSEKEAMEAQIEARQLAQAKMQKNTDKKKNKDKQKRNMDKREEIAKQVEAERAKLAEENARQEAEREAKEIARLAAEEAEQKAAEAREAEQKAEQLQAKQIVQEVILNPEHKEPKKILEATPLTIVQSTHERDDRVSIQPLANHRIRDTAIRISSILTATFFCCRSRRPAIPNKDLPSSSVSPEEKELRVN